MTGLRKFVRPSDHVTIVGGGYGVALVVAAHQASPSGHITVYEAGSDQIMIVEDTEKRNNVSELAEYEIQPKIVGGEINVFGEVSEQADILPPEDMADCDVLELDFEN